jgi:NADH-quinone oxidoreductase subunit E
MSSITPTTFEVLNKDLAEKIDTIITNNAANSTKLVGILLEVQAVVPKQYLPLEVAAYISQKMNIPLSRIYDVISFYAALSDVPRADCVIQLCDSVVCKVTGNTVLKDSLQQLLGIKVGEITPDSKYALEPTACFGACDIAPAIRVNGRVFGHLTSMEKVKKVLDNYK